MGIYIASGVCGLAGLLLSLYSLIRFVGTLNFIRSVDRISGKVVNLATARTSDHHLTYLPVFEYQTKDGARHQYTSTIASNPPAYEIGETRELLVSPQKTQNVKINSFSELWLTTIILTTISFILFFVAYLLFIAAAK